MKRVHVNCGAKYQAAFTEFLRLCQTSLNPIDDEKYILRFIGQVITVSLETQKIASDPTRTRDLGKLGL